MSGDRVGRAAAGMGVATLVSRFIGLGRVLVIGAVLGTTFLGNTFQSANSVSNVLFELLAAGALSSVLVPTFVRVLERDERDLDVLTRGLLGYACIGLGVVSAVGIVAAPWIARALTAGVPQAVLGQQRELTTYLLRWFVPQIMLYAFGAVATGVLHARRKFALTAAAPIANTLVVVVVLVAFRAHAGADPGFALDRTGRLLLALAGTGGVVAFVGVLVVAALRTGVRLTPRWPRRHEPGAADVRELVRHSLWGILLHSVAGLLLGAALIAGNSVEGGVVAYQAAFVFFLAPYAVLAQPLHTAVLPELASDATRGDLAGFATALRWSLSRIVVLVAPVTALVAAAGVPAMRALQYHNVDGTAVGACLAGLGLGLVPYSAFLLFARAMYAHDDSRTPAVVAVVSGVVGTVAMAVSAITTSGHWLLFALGCSHSAAYLVGAVMLGARLRARTHAPLLAPHARRALAAAAALAVVLAAGVALAGDHGRARNILVTVGAAAACGVVLVVSMRADRARGPMRAA